MNRIYCISGMGADERIFKNLQITGYEFVPVHWVPFDPNDDMKSYAQKLSKQILDEKPVILGLSFGGMLAIEIGKTRAIKKIFLVSSAKTSSELPWIGRSRIAKLLIKLAPVWLFTKPNYFSFWIAGAKNRDDRKILSAMMKNTPAGFIKRALNIVVDWKNNLYPMNVVQMHGTNDKIIFPSNMQPDKWVQGGTHIMVYNQAADVCKIITDSLYFC